MTGNGKTDKKFHTLQHQISVVFICLLLLSIFTITLINGLFLKILCIQKVEVLEEAKEVLSQMNLDDILQYDTDIEEDKKGQQMRFRMRLRGAVPEITLPGS